METEQQASRDDDQEKPANIAEAQEMMTGKHEQIAANHA
jgi:hypothetical protein